MSCLDGLMREAHNAAPANPQPEVEALPVWADVRVRCCARHELRHGADPIRVAALLGVCVEDLDDVLATAWP